MMQTEKETVTTQRDVYDKITACFLYARLSTYHKQSKRKICTKFSDLKVDMEPIRRYLLSRADENQNDILLYCIETLFRIIDEGDGKKVNDFADAVHNMPEICMGLRPLYTFYPEILGFRQRYGEEYFPFFNYDNTFIQMVQTAVEALVGTDVCLPCLPAPQVSVVLTDKGNLYTAVNDIDGAVCQTPRQEDDICVTALLTMWQGGGVDLPSAAFRKAVAALCAENRSASLYLQGTNGTLIAKPLSAVDL